MLQTALMKNGMGLMLPTKCKNLFLKKPKWECFYATWGKNERK